VRVALLYVAAQFVGALLGVWCATFMFAEPVWQVSTKLRDGWPQGFAEAVANLRPDRTIVTTQRQARSSHPSRSVSTSPPPIVYRIHLLRQSGRDRCPQPQ